MAKKKTKPRKPCIVLALVLSLLVVGSARADTCAVGLMPPFTAAQANKLCSTFVGDETIGASLIPGADNAYDIGDATHAIRSLYLGTSLLYNGDLLDIGAAAGATAVNGAFIQLNDNAEATNPADLYLESGDAATGDVFVRVNSTNGSVRFGTNSGAEVWSINSSGQIAQNATNGGSIVFNKGGTYVQAAPYVPTMAATPVLGTNNVLPGLNVIPTAAANTAAWLGASTPVPGQQFMIHNDSGATVRIKGAGAATINGGTAGKYIAILNGAYMECKTLSTGAQVCPLYSINGTVSAVPTPA